jgi:phosphoglycerate dehydrogenase-like enzyme
MGAVLVSEQIANRYAKKLASIAPETRHLIDKACLTRMKPDSAIINVGRGELIDESALIEALTNGKLRGAVLDVFETEPLPESNPLWDLPNVIVTPHCGGYTRASHEHGVEHFLANLARYEAGERLQNELHART